MLAVVLGDSDVVAKKTCGLGASMGAERLFRREFQMELFPQKVRQFTLDSLGLFLGAGEAQQKVIGIPNVPQAPVRRVMLIPIGQLLELYFQLGDALTL